jgi:NAD(P)-dependent dehydrogenase (short-subunit alcohol dehydrogenase family)
MNSEQPFDLSGEIALITGGGTGIGLGIAKCLHQLGAQVVLAGRRETVLRDAVAELGAGAGFRVHDVSDFDRAPGLVESITAEYGGLSILVNNAGIHLKKRAEEVTEAEFLQVLDVHLIGAHALSRAAALGMFDRNHGSIIFIASMASLFGIPHVLPYAAAKTAHLGMVRSLSTEWSPRGVRVNAIAPGWIHSEMTDLVMEADPERKWKILDRTPMRMFGEPEDIGWAAAYLCSPAARFVTGVCLPIDGGVSMGF